MEELSQYEVERLRTIQSNEAKLREILGDAARIFKKEKVVLTAAQIEERQRARERRQRELHANRRGSSRIQEKRVAEPVPSIAESEAALEALERELPKQRRGAECNPSRPSLGPRRGHARGGASRRAGTGHHGCSNGGGGATMVGIL